MQKFSACSYSGSDTKPEPGWDACHSDFVERGDGAGYACGLACDFGSCGASAASTSSGGSSGSTATSTSACSRKVDCSGRHCRNGDGDRAA